MNNPLEDITFIDLVNGYVELEFTNDTERGKESLKYNLEKEVRKKIIEEEKENIRMEVIKEEKEKRRMNDLKNIKKTIVELIMFSFVIGILVNQATDMFSYLKNEDHKLFKYSISISIIVIFGFIGYLIAFKEIVDKTDSFFRENE